MTRSAPVLLLVLLLVPVLAAAEQTLHLKDGSTLRGTIVRQEGGIVVFDGSFGRVEIPQTKIARIEYQDGDAPSAVAAPLAAEGVWDAPAGAAPPAAPTEAPRTAATGLILIPKIGYHQYGGAGWSSFPKRMRRDFDGPTVEVSLGASVHRAPAAEIQLLGMTGYYGGGTKECEESGFSCLELTLANFYLHGGPRFVVPAGQAAVYAQMGIGFHHSTFRVKGTNEDNVSFSDSDSRIKPSGHALLGLGVNTSEKLGFFFEARFLTANGKYPDATRNWDMGGTTYLAGAAFRL